MGMKTDIITYNVTELGRSFSGQKRAFNVEAFTRLINGEKVQEAVRNGDMVGYLGHDIRRNFGLRPPEVTMDNGKIVPIEPAFTTCYIKAYPDGRVEHQERFLDTPLGKVAQDWFMSKTGGFSSVVAPDERNPSDFLGFDYVRSPNFNANRGYTMDSAHGWDTLTNKQKIVILEDMNAEKAAVFDAMMQSMGNLSGAVNHSAMQANQLLAELATMDANARELELQLRDARAELAQHEPKFEPMMRLSVGAANWLESSIASFDSTERAAPSQYAPPIDFTQFL